MRSQGCRYSKHLSLPLKWQEPDDENVEITSACLCGSRNCRPHLFWLAYPTRVPRDNRTFVWGKTRRSYDTKFCNSKSFPARTKSIASISREFTAGARAVFGALCELPRS